MRFATEVARLKQLLSKQDLKSFWVGLTGDITPGSWTWNDGAALAAGDFTACDGDKLCAFARKQNGYRWGVTGCGERGLSVINIRYTDLRVRGYKRKWIRSPGRK
ncbi:hypothetical protein Bbelb_309180 [Branchiostoma belcheri]|nr:hypothetical protein Bbelb_309180 [Branchiostoma belcheri]